MVAIVRGKDIGIETAVYCCASGLGLQRVGAAYADFRSILVRKRFAHKETFHKLACHIHEASLF